MLDLIQESHPSLVPTKYGPFRPLKRKYSVASRDEVISVWLNEECSEDGRLPLRGTLLMSGKAPSEVEYHISWDKTQPRFQMLSFDVSLSYAADPRALERFMSLARQLADLTSAVFGTVQNFAYPGWEEPYDLKVRLPDPGWTLFFGKPYVDLFSEPRLMTAPVHKVQMLPSGHVEVMLTESPFDPVPGDAKRQFREHLGPDAFMEPGKSIFHYKAGMAPEFDFSAVLAD